MKVLDLKLSCLFLLYCAHTVTSRGSYMNAFRGNPNGSRSPTGTHIEWADAKPIIPSLSILQNADLAGVDQKLSLCNGVDIRELTILEIQKLFRSNALNSVALTNCYLQRIHHMNHILRAVIEVNPDAIAEAHEADQERILELRGPMHGIPILVKDNIDTFDKTETTAGYSALLGIRPRRDAEVVKLLRKAGAVIIGKTNLNYMLATNSPPGWSGTGGQTLNAYNFNENPEGSSSGSASATAANLVTVSLGTDTDGSLIAPSSVEGLCTLRSTLGLVSTKGIIPISHNQDVVGPMTRTMMDLAILFDVLVPQQIKNRLGCGGSYMQCLLQRDTKKTFRLGVLRYPFWDLATINSTYLAAAIPQLDAIVRTMESHPAFDVVDPVAYAPGQLESISFDTEWTVFFHDFKHGINQYLENDVISQFSIPPQIPPKRIASIKDIIQFNINHPNPEGYNQELLILAEATDGLRNRTYIAALESNRGAARRLLDFVLDKYNLDAIVVPSEPRVGTSLDSLADSPLMLNSVAAIAGYPSIVVPAGIGINGVPFGINFVGKPHTEAKLIQIAYEVESITRKRASPKFLF